MQTAAPVLLDAAAQVFTANLQQSPPTRQAAPPPGPALTTAALPNQALYPPEPPRAPSRSSTLLDAESLGAASPAFHALPLDMSETVSHVEGEGEESASAPAKESLEAKVSQFLARLRQDSINLDLTVPQPRPHPYQVLTPYYCTVTIPQDFRAGACI